MHLSKIYHRTCPGHPVYMNVKLFYKKNVVKEYLTLPSGSTKNDVKNVLVSTSNDIIAEMIATEHECLVEEQSITVAKHIAEISRLDLVHLMNMSCDRHTCDIEWDAYYYVPPGTSVQMGRMYLHFMENKKD